MSHARRAGVLPRLVLFLTCLSLPARAGEEELIISTVAGSGRGEPGPAAGKALEVGISQPFGVEPAPDGALYICGVGHHRVFRLDPGKGSIAAVAGSGKKGHGGDGGPAPEAQLNEPYEVRLDGEGNLYFVEMVGAVVRRVDRKTGVISTVAGTGQAGFSGDGGPATRAQFSSPHSIALDGRGGIFVADIGNHRIRRIDLVRGSIETIAGTGERALPRDGAVAGGQPILGPRALFVSGETLWIALREGNSVWSMDLASRKLTRVAGTGQAGFRDGPALEASFNGPKGITAGPDGDLFVADTENDAIRRIDLKKKTVTTVAGGRRGFGGDGGPALKASLDRPHGIAVDARGVLFIGDTENHRVRSVGPK